MRITPNHNQHAEKPSSNRHHSNRRFRGLGFRSRLSRRAGRTTRCTAGIGLRFGSFIFPATASRTAIPPAWLLGVGTFGSPRVRGTWCRFIVPSVEARGWWREVSTCEIFRGTRRGAIQTKNGCLVGKEIVAITVFIAAAKVDDIVMIRVRDNSVGLSILRQFVVTSFGVVH